MSTTNLFRLDFVIVTVVGSIVGLIFFNPVGYQQAFRSPESRHSAGRLK
jgi:hypothetical protein